MKKLILASVLTLALLMVMAYTVMADNGPHGSFAATTDACANCHRAHSAQVGSNSLLIKSDAETLCKSCHDGTGASTDVVDGVYHGGISPAPNGSEGINGASLFGGGFNNALMATAWSGATLPQAAFNAVSRPSTSAHALGVQGIVYGSGGINATEATMTLECTSCHNPHGNSGFQMTANTTTFTWTASTTIVPTYRLLRFQPQGSGGFTPPATSNWSGGAFPTSGTTSGWTVPDAIPTNGAEWYTIGTTNAFAVGDYNAGNATNTYNVTAAETGGTARNYINDAANIAYFCAQCHDRYFTNTRLRNDTDQSAYCGTPITATPVVVGLTTLTPHPDADGVAPWIHPVDPVRCEPVVDATTGALTAWGDNGSTGDAVHAYMHTSGDVLRASTDGTSIPTAAGMTAPTSVGRTCVACHVAHGTTAQMTTIAGQANQVFVETGVSSSVLLRMDNRSLCLRCHASTVGFTVAP
jgi:predicted CXXCH cytochrome family protein